MTNRKLRGMIALVAFLAGAAPLSAQNILLDGGFEGAPQSSFGDRGPQPLSPWLFAAPTGSGGALPNAHNLVAVDGPGGYDYFNNSSGVELGPESDASAPGAGVTQHYIDSGAVVTYGWQYFTPSCSGTATGTIHVTNREGHGRAEGTLFGDAVPQMPPGTFKATGGGLSILPVASQIPPFPPNIFVPPSSSVAPFYDLINQHRDAEYRFLLGAGQTRTYPWTPVTVQVPVQAGQTYAFVVRFNHSVNIDNASVVMSCPNSETGDTSGGGSTGGDPQTAITKTCDPIPADATAPFTLNCRLTVTASNLPAGSFVTVVDAFTAQPPAQATIQGGMMNVTSTENWSCVDAPQSGGSYDVGLCELPAADMAAAGGSSVLNVSFQFDVDQTPTQVANCRMVDISPSSVLEQLAGQGNARQAGPGWGDMPDGCVYVDVPGAQLETKVESNVRKTCDTPTLERLNGVWGYVWKCRAEINVTPSPFAGTFNFEDDASALTTGTAEFTYVSEPSACAGLGGDHLTCSFSGATMAAPLLLDYHLFTAHTGADEEIHWRNCVEGQAETPAGSFPAEPFCLDAVIKPQTTPDGGHDLPDLRDAKIEKSCAAPREMRHDGKAGMGWDCTITIQAGPAPFSGNFTFTENASALTGSPNGQIIAMSQPAPHDWNCAPGLPAQITNCTINGSDFDPSGEEVVGFTLFAETAGDEPITWRNCVQGIYAPAGGDKQEIKGNCATTEWKPARDDVSVPASFSLKKSCDGPTDFGDAQRYLCTINITQTGGDPITQPLTLEELFSSTTTGSLATQYMIALQGSSGWQCDMATATCTIQPADFNGSTGHQVSGIFLIPNGVLQEQDFQNCAALNMGEREVASAPCVPMDEPAGTQDPDAPDLDISKSCVFVGPRYSLSGSFWAHMMECTLTVTSNGVPFQQPIWVNENMAYGPHSGNAYIVSIDSADPWQCAAPPYGAPSGNAPVCSMDPSQFPYSAGQSQLTVTLSLLGGSVMTYGAENCVSLTQGKEPGGNPDEVLAEDCVEFYPPAEEPRPSLDLVKSCARPIARPDHSGWDVACEITISGQNLPAGEQIRVVDMLGSSALQNASFGFMTAPGNGCGGGLVSGGFETECIITTDDIINAGGSLTIPYLGTYQGGPGFALSGPAPQNCAWADSLTAQDQMHAPDTPEGKSCVRFDFALEQLDDVMGGIILPDGTSDPCGDEDGSDPVVVPDGGPLDPVVEPDGTLPHDPGDSSDPVVVPDGGPLDPVIVPDGTIPHDTPDGDTGADDASGPIVVDDVVMDEPITDQALMRPLMQIEKTCTPLRRVGQDLWGVNCQITLLVRNLPRGQNIQLTDLIDPGLGLYVQSANWIGAGVTCTGSGPLAQCFIPTDNLSHDAHFGPGETITLNYTAVLQAPAGDPRPDQPRENCVRASLPHEGAVVQAPAANGDPNRSYCVPLTLDLEGSSSNAGDTQDCSLDTFFVVDKSGSMRNDNRMTLTRQAVLAAFASFEGNGSTSSVLTFASGTHLLGGGTSHTLPSSILQTEVPQISAYGGTRWSTALAEANTLIAPMTEKPLVLFITDGMPHDGVQPSMTHVATLRAQGSRVLGIAIGQGGHISTLTDLLGPNLVTTGPGVVVNPMVNDVIHITDSSHIVPSFEQIARAYCPSTQGMTPQQRDALEQAILSMPKSAAVAPDGDPYFGDEPWPEATQTPEASAPRNMPELVITKAHSGTCTANRNSQLYDCGFRLSLTNTGTAPFNGPLVVSDSFGNAPAVRSATLLSGGGWSCAGPVAGAVLCETAGLTLLPGASAHLDLTMQIEGMRAGGQFNNCAAIGVPGAERQRVAMLQQVMNARGLNAGPVDGLPGRKTYAALAQLQQSLGLPVSREIGDDLFAALGLPLQEAGAQGCAMAELPPMPAPPLQCDSATTVKSGESCVCRFDGMVRRNATSCGCARGYKFVAGKGCEAIPAPRPAPESTPAPAPAQLRCDPRSTRAHGDQCVCIDQKNARKTSATTCGCTSGLPMVNGHCLAISIDPGSSDNPAGQEKCLLRVNGICVK